MSIIIERGARWFRPMKVELVFTIMGYEEANTWAERLEHAGLRQEAHELKAAIAAEQQDTKLSHEVGYICDPERKYPPGEDWPRKEEA